MPLLYCVADYAENWSLAEVLQAHPNIPYRLARQASFLTAAKSQLIVAALGIAVALAIAAWGLTRRAASDQATIGPAIGSRRRAASRDGGLQG